MTFQYFSFQDYLILIQVSVEDQVFTPSLSDSKNLGSGFSLPYFWAINDDKNFTLTNKLYLSENPLFLGEYHQAFKNSSFLADFGFTEGYKKSTGKKKLETNLISFLNLSLI